MRGNWLHRPGGLRRLVRHPVRRDPDQPASLVVRNALRTWLAGALIGLLLLRVRHLRFHRCLELRRPVRNPGIRILENELPGGPGPGRRSLSDQPVVDIVQDESDPERLWTYVRRVFWWTDGRIGVAVSDPPFLRIFSARGGRCGGRRSRRSEGGHVGRRPWR